MDFTVLCRWRNLPGYSRFVSEKALFHLANSKDIGKKTKYSGWTFTLGIREGGTDNLYQDLEFSCPLTAHFNLF